MIQEVDAELEDYHVPAPTAGPIATSTSSTSIALPDFYVKKTGPTMEIQLTDDPTENSTAYKETMQKYLIWTICREVCSTGKQKVPALSGFISKTGVVPERVSTIDYYPMINEPITEFKVVR